MIFYTVTDHYDPIGQQQLDVQCPECHQPNCLELHFYQKRIETSFSTKISKRVTGVLFCHHTQSEVSPVLWTDEIERSFKAEKAKLRLTPTSLKFNKWFYFIIAVPILAFAVAMGYHQWQTNAYTTQSANIEQISEGKKVGAMLSLIENHQTVQQGNTWLLATRIDADTIWLRVHKDLNSEKDFEFDLATEHFNGRILKASLPRFRERFLTGFDYTDQEFSGYITEIE